MRTEKPDLLGVDVDGIVLKPAEVDIERGATLPTDLVIDFEGTAHLPDPETLSKLAGDRTVRVTTPVRADGFDPLGDDSAYDRLPNRVKVVLVAGNPAYLTPAERDRGIAPRLRAAADRFSTAWVGTEGIERLALAIGGTQFQLLGPDTEREFRALRAAGYEGGLAVYAPVVVATDEDAVLDAIGPYVARRQPVRTALPAGAQPDGGASGRTRAVLLDAIGDYALVGTRQSVRDRVRRLRAAGADHVVCYPAQGLSAVE